MRPASGSPNPLRFPHIFHALPASQPKARMAADLCLLVTKK
jgi:hypothetical protein